MNLYRLDPSEALDCLWRTRKNARAAAIARAIRRSEAVAVSKIDGRTLRVAHVMTASPDGRITNV